MFKNSTKIFFEDNFKTLFYPISLRQKRDSGQKYSLFFRIKPFTKKSFQNLRSKGKTDKMSYLKNEKKHPKKVKKHFSSIP